MSSSDTTPVPNDAAIGVQATGGADYRKYLIDLLSSIQQAQVALQRWDAAAFERAVAEQQRICDLLQQVEPSPADREASILVVQVRAALRSYRLLVDRGTRWCRTLSSILGETATQPSVSLRSEL
ncbi:MAG TPA: hypothetical protein VMT82_03675 [candidate division Zixibacteria bacterium]|nr:hypothetical protein [candidate division Zixibacteria bacterium]